MGIKLNKQTLKQLPKSISVPNYEIDSLTAGIIHIGVGNFHRAHQAYYLDQLFELGIDHDWAIIGAGIKSYDSNMRDRLSKQDWLTTLLTLDPNKLSSRVIGSMVDFLPIDSANTVKALSKPEIRIVSLTITEGGYYINDSTDDFDSAHPEIIEDVSDPDNPKTVFGLLIASLKKRRELSIAPFTIMSCDNLPENGHIAKRTLLALAKMIDTDLAEWIKENVSFPNGMVDCITPATTELEIDLVKNEFDLIDIAPVTCEPFHQWVLEDQFPNGRPKLEKVGVQFVDDVRPYELMKLRILNGGHAIIAYAAALLDITYAHEAMEHPVINSYMDRVEQDEIIPIVPPVPNTSLEDYLTSIKERFSNPRIADRIDRLCFDGSNRQPKFIIPSIADNLTKSNIPTGLILESALWCRYCQGRTDGGKEIASNDPKWNQLHKTAMNAKTHPEAWLEMADIYGDLGQDKDFRKHFSKVLYYLTENGVENTLNAYLNRSL